MRRSGAEAVGAIVVVVFVVVVAAVLVVVLVGDCGGRCRSREVVVRSWS